MRSYLIDELSFLERDNLDSFLKRTLKPGALNGVFFLAIPPELLGPAQTGKKKLTLERGPLLDAEGVEQ